MNSKANSFLNSCNKPGALAELYAVALEMLADPNISHAKLTRVLSMDPCIVAAILKLTFSSLSQAKKPTADLSQAITVLGVRRIRQLVNQIKPQASDSGNGPLLFKDLWKHSLAVGTAARIIDRSLGGNSAEIFTAALLHDFGRMIMYLNCDRLPIHELKLYCENKHQLQYKQERKFLGFSHMELTDTLFQTWRFPAIICEPAAYHHTPLLAVRCKYETAIVHIANIICGSLELGHSGDNYVPVLDESTVKFLGLDLTQLDMICEETHQQLQESLHDFGLS